MFFVFGISNDKKHLYKSDLLIHDYCGKYGKYDVFMTYNYFSLFFIPVIKWRKEYFVVYTCCGKVYQLNPEIGKQYSRGEYVNIKDRDLIDIGEETHPPKICSSCGYISESDYSYCPKCGTKF
ncbi:MAG: zinc ribbon domain-containing protein [Tissierellia bacterium]|nr:zinc ribbon domain-containing protein [Tissierellia bacterium]